MFDEHLAFKSQGYLESEINPQNYRKTPCKSTKYTCQELYPLEERKEGFTHDTMRGTERKYYFFTNRT
jgi:hypothetical protein